MAATVDVTGNTIVKFRVTVTKPRNIQWPAPPRGSRPSASPYSATISIRVTFAMGAYIQSYNCRSGSI